MRNNDSKEVEQSPEKGVHRMLWAFYIGNEQKTYLKSGFILQSVDPWHLFREAIFFLSMHSSYCDMIIWTMTRKLSAGSFGDCCVRH